MARLLLDHLTLGRGVPHLPEELRREIYRQTFPRPCRFCDTCGTTLLSYDVGRTTTRLVMVSTTAYTVVGGDCFRCMACLCPRYTTDRNQPARGHTR